MPRGVYKRTPEGRANMSAAVKGKKVLSTRGESHWNWNGGRKEAGGGYISILVDGKYRKEHRVVMEEALGRSLASSEEVHHINGLRSDNRLENLLVVSRSEHRILEGRLLRAAYLAVQAGAITFEDGNYRFTCHVTAT